MPPFFMGKIWKNVLFAVCDVWCDIPKILIAVRNMGEGINKRGGNAKLTVYPNTEHNAWDPTYSNPEVWAWMLSQRRVKKDTTDSGVSDMDSKRFG